MIRSPARRPLAPPTAIGALLAVAGFLAACAPGPPPSRAEPGAFPSIVPAVTASIAIPGRALLIPAVVDQTALAGGAPIDIRATLDPGAPIPAALYRVEWSAPPALADGWLEPAPVFAVTPVASAADAAPGARVAFFFSLAIPADARGRALAVGGVPVALAWSDPPPPRLPRPRLPALALSDLAHLLRALDPAALDPSRRWRVRLLFDRLATRGIDPGESATLSHPLLEMLARQIEDRWRLGLARLHAADPALHDDALDSLTAIVGFENGRTLPLWHDASVVNAGPAPAEVGAPQELLEAMLDASLAPARLADRARAWLAAQPRALAWIDDDAGEVGAVRVGLANLSARPVAAAVTGEGAPGVSAREVEMVALAPFQAGVVSLRAPAGAPASGISASIGHEELSLGPVTRSTPVAPPGLRFDAWRPPRTMQSLLSGAVLLAPADRATAALLQRRPADQPTEPGDSRWELTLECISPVGAAADSVRIFLGPTAAPRAVLRIDHRGFMLDEAASPDAPASRARPAPVTRLADRWLGTAPIPASALEPDGSLLIGLERIIDAERFTWPRAVFPWQSAPPRIRADLSAWGGIDAPADAPR